MTEINSTETIIKRVAVAIAVIEYNQQYLLAYRNVNQHQGDLYEFIGGKIEAGERPLQALKRELKEEIGLAIDKDNEVFKLGTIEHDYIENNQGDPASRIKKITRVCLQVYQLKLNQKQHVELSRVTTGCEGQPLVWVDRYALIGKQYPLPEANKQILEWIKHV